MTINGIEMIVVQKYQSIWILFTLHIEGHSSTDLNSPSLQALLGGDPPNETCKDRL